MMTNRHLRHSIAGALLALGTVAIAPALGQAPATPDLPLDGQRITVFGCLVRGDSEEHDKLVLARASAGLMESTTESTCTASNTESVIRLQDMKQVGLNEAYLGRWMIIDGRLESQHKVHKLREIHVKSFRPVPVVVPPPPVAEVVIPPPVIIERLAPSPQAAAPVQEPVATTGTADRVLPKTATSLPLVGLIGLVSLVGGLAFHLFNRRAQALA
jgi:LPXTG-motif cell wall-anchored protein